MGQGAGKGQRQMEIGPASPHDLAEVRRLLARHHLPLDGVDEHVETMIVARDGSGIIGSAAVEVYDDGALLRSVAVDPIAQGQRLGQRLTEAALRLAHERGVDAVFLLTTTAERYFPKFGFETIARTEVPPGVQSSIEFRSACPVSAVAMRKRLDA